MVGSSYIICSFLLRDRLGSYAELGNLRRSEEYQVGSVGVYRREVTTNVPEGNAWFYNQNRPDIYWFRPGYPENEGPYGGEIITMPNDWERDSTSMKPLQAQFNTLGDFMELKLKIDPWSGRTPHGGLTSYLDKIRSTNSPFMIPLRLIPSRDVRPRLHVHSINTLN